MPNILGSADIVSHIIDAYDPSVSLIAQSNPNDVAAQKVINGLIELIEKMIENFKPPFLRDLNALEYDFNLAVTESKFPLVCDYKTKYTALKPDLDTFLQKVISAIDYIQNPSNINRFNPKFLDFLNAVINQLNSDLVSLSALIQQASVNYLANDWVQIQNKYSCIKQYTTNTWCSLIQVGLW
ncbi:MAG: hypothetical protein EAZ53_11185 [Bacteroidetes bacterium]|nr:MAG: hypothetical protein EAZ53_11185 [Bacteroidota bacterium]